jgi:hypothetical protein
VAAALEPLERDLLAAAREAAGPEVLDALARDAAVELAPYRDRLGSDAWRRAIDTTVDRLLRERFRLPMMTE